MVLMGLLSFSVHDSHYLSSTLFGAPSLHLLSGVSSGSSHVDCTIFWTLQSFAWSYVPHCSVCGMFADTCFSACRFAWMHEPGSAYRCSA